MVIWIRGFFLTAALLLVTSSAFAITIVDDEERNVQLGALVEGALDIPTDQDVESRFDPGVARARLQLRATQSEALGVFLQLSGDGGDDVILLDAMARTWIFDTLSLQVGRFKMPVSLEFAQGIGRLVFPDRSLASALTLKRGDGGMLVYETSTGGADIEISGGAFVVTRGGQTDEVASLGVDVRFRSTTFHLGASESFADEAAADIRYARNEAIDVGILYRHARWMTLVEAAVISPFRGSDPVFAGYGVLGYRFASAGVWDFEVAGAGDIVVTERNETGRVSGGFNLYHSEASVIGTIAYVFELVGAEDDHMIQIRLQAGL